MTQLYSFDDCQRLKVEQLKPAMTPRYSMAKAHFSTIKCPRQNDLCSLGCVI